MNRKSLPTFALLLTALLPQAASADQSTPKETFYSFMKAIPPARDIREITPFLTSGQEAQILRGTKEYQKAQLSWYKRYWVTNIRIDNEVDEGEQAEMTGTCDWYNNMQGIQTGRLQSGGEKFRLQLFIEMLKETDERGNSKWKVKYWREEQIKSPFVK